MLRMIKYEYFETAYDMNIKCFIKSLIQAWIKRNYFNK